MSQIKFAKSEIEFIKIIFNLIKKYKFIGMTFTLSIGQFLYIFLSPLTGALVDDIFIKKNANLFWLLLFPLTWTISYAFTAISKIFTSTITQDVRKYSKQYIFDYLIGLSNNVYMHKGAGEIEILMQEVSFSSRYAVAESLPFFIRIFISILVSGLILAYNSVWLGIIFMVWMFLYIPLSYLISKNAVKDVSQSLLSSTEVSSLAVDIIENHELIPAFGTEIFEKSNFQTVLNKERETYFKVQLKIDKADAWQNVIQLLLPVSVVLLMIFNHSQIDLSPGDIVALFTIILIITAQLRDFGRGVLAFFEIKERMKAALEHLRAFQQLSKKAVTSNGAFPVGYDIVFNEVNFAYDSTHAALKDISFTIKENEKIGIIGYSGAGKTTLIRLLRGFYTPTSGTIYLGGISLNKINPKFLAANIAEVSQTIPLFNRTIYENITYGCKDVPLNQIWKILEKAQLADYVKKLPKGLDTVVGVKGTKLSGGERARLAIARALLRDSKIIILDEAMASLDSETELLLQKGIEELIANRTVIAIAHRLSALRSIDRILVFENGKIVANGCPNHLFQTNQLYRKLKGLQALTVLTK